MERNYRMKIYMVSLLHRATINYHTEMINTATQNLYSKIIPHCFMEILCEIKIDKHQHFTGRLAYPLQFPPFFLNLHTRDMKHTHEFINRASQ